MAENKIYAVLTDRGVGILNPQKIAVTRLSLHFTYRQTLGAILSVRWGY